MSRNIRPEIHTLNVHGPRTAEFPLDQLRRFELWPADETAATVIRKSIVDHVLGHGYPADRRHVKLNTTQFNWDRNGPEIIKRFSSFGWVVSHDECV